MPTDPGQRARARVLMHLGDNQYDSSLGSIVGEVFFKPKGQADQNVIAKAKQDLNACFERLERELGNNDYLLGTALTLPDICFVNWAPLFPMLQIEVPSQLTKVNAWLNRMKERPSVKAAG
jgi:glutathione S-transferase